MLNLSSFPSIQTNLFIKIVTPTGTEYFSDYYKAYTINGELYNGLGVLLGVTETEDNLRAAPGSLDITLSGIPQNFVAQILSSKLKGSPVTIYRAFFDATTGQLLSVGENPAGKFRGIVNNFSIQDDLTMGETLGTMTLIIECTSYIELLQNKIAGRKTNPIDQKKYFPSDLSMDRVPNLTKSNYDFGAPK